MKYFLHISAWVVRPDNQRVGKVLGLGLGGSSFHYSWKSLLKVISPQPFSVPGFPSLWFWSLWWWSLGESASGLLQGGSWGTSSSCTVGGGKNLGIQPHCKPIFIQSFCVFCPVSVPYLSVLGMPPSPDCLLCSVTPFSSLLYGFPCFISYSPSSIGFPFSENLLKSFLIASSFFSLCTFFLFLYWHFNRVSGGKKTYSCG